MKLVECKEEYWEFVRFLRTNDENQTGFFTKAHITPENQIEFMNKWKDNYKICLLDDIPVGYIGIINGNEVTYCTDPNYKNKGIGTFMVKEFLKFFPDLIATVKPENLASQRVFEKLGWDKKIVYVSR